MPDEEKCPKVTFYAPSDKLGGDKPIPSCLPGTIRVPDELKAPEEVYISDPELQTARPIVIASERCTVECPPDGSIGDSVTVEAGLFTTLVTLSSVQNISDITLNYIAVNEQEEVIERHILEHTLTKEYLQTLGLTATQSEFFINLVNRTLTQLNDSARAYALSKLVCLWWNAEVTAECPPDAARREEHPDAVWSVTVPANTISSSISQEAADEQARLQAEAGLNCFYISDPVEVSCAPDSITGDPVVDDHGIPVYTGLVPRKPTVSLPRGAFISLISVEDATTQARSFAESQLVCYFVNDEINVHCEDPLARNRDVIGRFKDPATGDYYYRYPEDSNPVTVTNPFSGTSGQIVNIAKGFITSELSSVIATQEAQTLADASLECCFINKRIHLECPPYVYTYIDANGEEQERIIPASELQSPLYSVTVERGVFKGCNSQQEVDDQALASVEGVLQCYYCNNVVLPICVPDWVVKAADTGIYLDHAASVPVLNEATQEYVMVNIAYGGLYTISLPLVQDRYYNPITREIEYTSTWSEDATVGAPREYVCGTSYEQSQQVAESAADIRVESIHKQSADSCQYTNDLLLAGCDFVDPYGATPSTTGSRVKVQYYEGKLPDSGESYFVYRANIDPYVNLNVSVPSANPLLDPPFDPELPVGQHRRGGYVTVPAGTISITAADVPDSFRGPKPIDTSTWEKEEEEVDEDGNPTGEIIFPEGEQSSVVYPGLAENISETQRIKAYANELARTMALGMVECIYTNPRLQASCLDDAARISPGAPDNTWEVPAATFTSTVSYKEVYTAAREALGAGPVCLYPNEEWPCFQPCDTCFIMQEGLEIPASSISNTGAWANGYKIPKETFWAASTDEANDMANTFCASMRNAVNETDNNKVCMFSIDAGVEVSCTAACSAYGLELSAEDRKLLKFNTKSFLEWDEPKIEVEGDKLIVKSSAGTSGSATCEGLYLLAIAMCKAACQATASIAFTNIKLNNQPCDNGSGSWDLDEEKFVGTKEEVLAMIDVYKAAKCTASCGTHSFDVCTKQEVIKNQDTNEETTVYYIKIWGGRVYLPNNCYLDIPTQPSGDEWKSFTMGMEETVKLTLESADGNSFTWKYMLGGYALFSGTAFPATLN